jgi:hypothetical protein
LEAGWLLLESVMVKPPFLSLSGSDHRGLMAQGKKSLIAGAKRNGQIGKLGAIFRGNRFFDCADCAMNTTQILPNNRVKCIGIVILLGLVIRLEIVVRRDYCIGASEHLCRQTAQGQA